MSTAGHCPILRGVVPTPHETSSRTHRRDLGRGAVIDYESSFVLDHEAAMTRLLAELPLEQESIRMIGRLVPVPRLVCFHGEPGKRYRYSGRDHEALLWTPTLRVLVEQLRAFTGTPYDTVLCNFYRDGMDAMGKHSDDEKELGPSPDDLHIASISLGARRIFRMRRKDGSERFDLQLGHGDLLVMSGTTQAHWTHEVPRTKAMVGPRLNLTFRCVKG
jgi:alkylated DNA repair dioxygenase AlkB